MRFLARSRRFGATLLGVALLCGSSTDPAEAKPRQRNRTRGAKQPDSRKQPPPSTATATAEPRDDANVFYIHVPAYAFVPLSNSRYWVRKGDHAYTIRDSSATRLVASLNFPVEPGRAYIRELRCTVRDGEPSAQVEYTAGVGGIVGFTTSSTHASAADPPAEVGVAKPKQIIYLDTKEKSYTLSVRWWPRRDPSKSGWAPQALRFEGCRVTYYVEPRDEE